MCANVYMQLLLLISNLGRGETIRGGAYMRWRLDYHSRILDQ